MLEEGEEGSERRRDDLDLIGDCKYLLRIALKASRRRHLRRLRSMLTQRRQNATSDAECQLANQLWFAENCVACYIDFFAAFSLLKQKKYYPAWCKLERIEIRIQDLKRNSIVSEEHFEIDLVARYTSQWQSLFPYAYFFSPEMIIKQQKCSICQSIIGPRSTCRHQVGQLYCGRICFRIVTDMTPISISLVKNPVQKFSVVFLSDEKGRNRDQYNYELVTYACDLLQRPFDRWIVEWGHALHPHAKFADRDLSGPCPCDSGAIYKFCCYPREGVIRPHVQITVQKPPQPHLPSFSYAGYERKVDGDAEDSDTVFFSGTVLQGG